MDSPINDKQSWFRAKRYGWGWGLPCSWQGWVVMVAYFVLTFGGILMVPSVHPGFWIGYLVVLTVALIVVCVVKGEKPRWRWGGE